MLTVHSIADSFIVQIDVGSEGKRYHWHEDLITQESPFFKSRIAEWYEANEDDNLLPLIELPEAATDCFQIISEWLYKPSISARLEELGCSFACSLYQAATDYGIERLQNDIIDFLRTSQKVQVLGLRVLALYLLRAQTHRPEFPMQEFWLSALAYKIACNQGRYAGYAKANTEQVAKLFSYPKVAEHLMLLVCDYYSPRSRQIRPFVRDLTEYCMFHRHENGSECPAGGRLPM